MARVYTSDGGFKHPQLHGTDGAGMFGSRARPGMGLFGSQGRPGMKAGSSLGSLGGNSLGVSSAAMLSEPSGAITSIGADEPATTPAPAVKPPMSTQTKVLIGAGIVAAWWMFFKK